jgi:pimeloyl-ACP methyl ester carboxylesterase
VPQHREVLVNGITMHIAEQGTGPLVLLLHGWPESWYVWRHQFQPLSDAGFHVVAPDQRGYGGTDRPEGVDQYTILHLVGDVIGLIEALGERQAVVVGHDWGAPVAWNTALLRPDVVRGVVGLSVAPSLRPSVPPLSILGERFGAGFYQLYFQQQGVPEAELGEDVPATFRKIFAGSPVGTSGKPMVASDGAGFLAGFREPETLPAWLTEEDIAAFVEQYARNGFSGGLNWYRNIDRNWELTAPWEGARITAPALYVTGQRDVVRTFGDPRLIERLPALLPNLRGVVDLPDTGHWIQQERPAEVTAALSTFLGGL